MSDKGQSRSARFRGVSQSRKGFLRNTLLSVAAGIFATALRFWALSDEPIPAKPTEELPAGAMQAKATTACLECHEARIILQQRLSKAAWTKEVDKMTKWGAVVDANDRDALIDYLSTNFSPDRPAYEAPRMAVAKSNSARSAEKIAK
jgi:mono/diheme cytochrome c family protein